jgi:hypothetical protein
MQNANRSLVVLFFVCISCTAGAVAQPSSPLPSADSLEVRAVIDVLFDGMRAGDSSAVRTALHPKARFMTTLVRDGVPVLHDGGVQGFVEAVGRPHDEIWDERIWNVSIHIDGLLASAWMDYAFFLGSEFSHCGVNAFQFFKAADGWKVIQITDTRRTEDCELPDDL